MIVRLVGFDPSLRNWGFCLANFNTQTKALDIYSGDVIQYKPDKSLKQSIQDLATANALYRALKPLVEQADYYVAEFTHRQSIKPCNGLVCSLYWDIRQF